MCVAKKINSFVVEFVRLLERSPLVKSPNAVFALLRHFFGMDLAHFLLLI